MQDTTMGWHPILYGLCSFLGAAVCALVAGVAWRERSDPAAPAFIALMFGFGGWALLYAIHFWVPTHVGQLLWQRLALAVGGTIPTLWLVFVLRYTARNEWLTGPTLAALALEPLAFGLVVLTNPTHGLVWESMGFPAAGGPRIVLLELGPGYYAHIAYAYLLVSGGLAVLGVALVRGSRLFRTQTTLLIAGALPPFAMNVAYSARLDWGPLPAVDLTPLVLPLTGVVFGLTLYEFDLMERAPVAHARLLAETNDGAVVLDDQGTIVSVNPTARQILTADRPTGHLLEDVLPGDLEGEGDDLGAVHGRTIEANIGGRRRVYDTRVTPLSVSAERGVGYALELRDVTARHAYEQRLEVANRVLRHNLRNKMNVVQGWAEYIATGSEDPTRAATTIAATAEDLIALSDKTRAMVTTGMYAGGESAPEVVDVSDLVGSLLEEFRGDCPDATIEADIPPDLRVLVPDVSLVEIATTNLLENAIKHNDADHPRVSVTVDRPDGATGRIRIRVSDNGPGIPVMEREVLEDGTETPLHHGRGLGLWLVYWCVTTAGGEVSFDTNEPRGSTVSITMQSADCDDAAAR